MLITDHDRTSVLVGDGRLPLAVVELADGRTTVQAAVLAAREHLGFGAPVAELLFDFAAIETLAAGEPVPALVTFEAADAGWTAPPDTGWVPLAAAALAAPAGSRERVETLTAEWAGRALPHRRRARWARPGWFAEAHDWIAGSLAAAGRAAPTEVEQVRHWGISAVMRVEAPDGRSWFKAVFPGFAQEPATTEMLATELPDAVAPVIAADPARGWLLLDDVGSATFADHLDEASVAIARLIDLQHRFVGRADELLAAGLVDRRLTRLADDLAEELATDVVGPHLAADRADALVTWVRRAADEVALLGLPDTLVHGDFHPGNVARRDGKAILFDWSDAAVSNPVVDLMTWVWWFEDDQTDIDRTWELFADGWADVVDRSRLLAHRPRFEGLLGAYHLISYSRLLAMTEPVLRPEHADGITQFLGILDRVVPA